MRNLFRRFLPKQLAHSRQRSILRVELESLEDRVVPNAAPILGDIDERMGANQILSIQIYAFDPDGDDVTLSANTPNNGFVDIVGNQLQYVPNWGFLGTETIQLYASDPNGGQTMSTVTVEVTNTLPYASDHIYCFVVPGGSISGNVLANAYDENGDTIVAGIASGPTHGVLNDFDSDGSFSYTAPFGFIGTDVFQFAVSDGHGDDTLCMVYFNVGEVFQGFVYNSATGAGVANVGVSIEASDNDGGPVHTGLTDSNGAFTFAEMEFGELLITYSAPAGYVFDLTGTKEYVGGIESSIEFHTPDDVTVSSDLALTPPSNLTVPVGSTPTLAVQAFSGVGIANVEWWVSEDGEYYSLDPDLTGVSDTFHFDHYGDYDFWLVATDKNGNTAETSFRVTASEMAFEATITGPGEAVVEGTPAIFTIVPWNPDSFEFPLVEVDWEGTGLFEDVGEDEFTAHQNGSFSFGHYYATNGAMTTYSPIIRLTADGGTASSFDQWVVVEPKAITGNFSAGVLVDDRGWSGDHPLWLIYPGEQLRFSGIGADIAEGLVYHWEVTKSGQAMVPETTTVPFLSLPDYTAGTLYTITAWVRDRSGQPATQETHQIVVGVGGGTYAEGWNHEVEHVNDYTAYFGRHDDYPNSPDSNFVFGYVEIKDSGIILPDSKYFFQDSNHNRIEEWGGEPLSIRAEVSQATRDKAAAENESVRFRFVVKSFIADTTGIVSLEAEYVEVNTTGVFDFAAKVAANGGWSIDRYYTIRVDVELLNDGGVRYVADNFGHISIPTPKTPPPVPPPPEPSIYEQFVNTVEATLSIRNVFTQERAEKLLNLFGSSGGLNLLFDTYTSALKLAMEDFVTGLPTTVKDKLFKWMFGETGGVPSWLNDTALNSLVTGTAASKAQAFTSIGLQYAGLTWDRVYGVVLQKLGAGNLDAVERVMAWINSNIGSAEPGSDSMDMFKFVENLATEMGNEGAVFLSEIENQLKQGFEKMLISAGARAGVQLAAKFVPGAGTFVSIYQGFQWFINNQAALGEVFEKFMSTVDLLDSPDRVNAIRNRILEGLNSAVGPLLNFGAQQLGLGTIPQNLRKALEFIPKKVDDFLGKAIEKIAAKLPEAFIPAKPGLFAGKLGALVPFDHANLHYVLWVAQDGTKVKSNVVKVAVKDGLTYKFVSTLKVDDFIASEQEDIGNLITAAQQLVNATKPQTKNKAALTNLVTLQTALKAAEDRVILDIQANACKALNAGCFAADTKLWTPGGYKSVQDFVAGDMIYSRDEWNPSGPVEVKLVEEVFVRYAGILALHAGGQVIRTTGEHPFYARGKGWTACNRLQVGDMIRTEDGWVAVEEVWDTGDWEVVYNVRVADYHTYFVGEESWGWSLWAHNTYAQAINTHEGHSYPVEANNPEAQVFYRSIVATSEYTEYADRKHLRAKTDAEAKIASSTGKRHAQYLACLAKNNTNNGLELLALQKGYIVKHGNGTYHAFLQFDRVIGYDEGVEATWIRAEITNGDPWIRHGHPMKDSRVPSQAIAFFSN